MNRTDRLGLIASAIDCYTDWRGCEVCYNKNTGEVVSRNCVGGSGLTESFGIGDDLDEFFTVDPSDTPSNETEPDPMADLDDAINAAKDALKNPSKDCLALFGGKTADEVRAMLDAVIKNGIGYSLDYARYDPGTQRNVTTQFPSYPNGSVADGITHDFKTLDGEIVKTFTFRAGGGFSTLMVPVTDFSTGRRSNLPLSSFVGFGGLSPDQLRGVMILHELRHVAGVSPPGHGDSRSNMEFTKEVATKCFGGT